jgi:Na+-translocating ferredoxin:NAD+ oxidoreductase subunit B
MTAIRRTTAMAKDAGVFRLLQQHLDRQAVAFPASRTGADVRILQRLFSPEEARIALLVQTTPAPLAEIAARAVPEFSAEQTELLLRSMASKGSLGWKEKGGVEHWFVMPLVIGMFETSQDGTPAPELLADVDRYFHSGYGIAFVSSRPTQARTIPIGASIPVEHHVATYDRICSIVQSARGPFVILKCICREIKAMAAEPCAKTTRSETCLALDDAAQAMLRRSRGREVSRGEAVAILQQNQAEGLVLQTSNAQRPEFVCSCCGCCCGLLRVQKQLTHPVDFWTSNHHAVVTAGACSGCGDCVARCQVGAVTMTGPDDTAQINLARCIGCGLCVPTCPSGALHLEQRSPQITPPEDPEALYEAILSNRRKASGQV